MKTPLLYAIGVICCILFGCKTNNKTNNKNQLYRELKVDLTDQHIKVSGEVFKNISFIKLETTNKSLFDNAGKVIHFDNKLFIRTTLERGVSVLVFKDTGEFMFKIERGRGPEEVVFPSDIAIDEKNKHLLVLDRYQVLKYFDFDGKYLKTTTLEDEVMFFETLGKKTIAFDSDKNKKTDYYLSIWDKNNLEKQFIPKAVSDIRKGPFIYPYPFSKTNTDSLFISCYFSDTIYCACNEGQDVFPFYVIDYNGRSANEPDRLKRTKSIYEYGQACQDQNYGSGPKNFVKIGNKLFFSIKAGQDHFVVYDLVQNKPSLHANLFKGLPNMYNIAGCEQEQIIFSITTPRLVEYFAENKPSESDSEVVKQLRAVCTNEDDNPILLFCKF